MAVYDKKYNEQHCDDCERTCGDCQDAFEEPGGAKHAGEGHLFSRALVYDPGGVTVWRYAQRKALDQLAELSTVT